MKQYIYLFVFIAFSLFGINHAYADNDNVEQEMAMRVHQSFGTEGGLGQVLSRLDEPSYLRC